MIPCTTEHRCRHCDTVVVHNPQAADLCTWCQRKGLNGALSLQHVAVMEIDAKTITLRPADTIDVEIEPGQAEIRRTEKGAAYRIHINVKVRDEDIVVWTAEFVISLIYTHNDLGVTQPQVAVNNLHTATLVALEKVDETLAQLTPLMGWPPINRDAVPA